MAGCGKSFGISGKLFTTYSTVNYGVVATVYSTSGSGSVFLYRGSLGMTVSIDICLRNKRFATYITYYAIGKTCRSTGGSVSGNSLLGMSVSIDDSLRNKRFATYITNYAIGKTCRSTGGSVSGNTLFGMSKRINLAIYIAVATYRAGMSSVSALSTSRIGNYIRIAVTGSVNRLNHSGELFATSGTVNHGVIRAGLGAGGLGAIFFNRICCGMSKRIKRIHRITIFAHTAGVGVITVLDTGGRSSYG